MNFESEDYESEYDSYVDKSSEIDSNNNDEDSDDYQPPNIRSKEHMIIQNITGSQINQRNLPKRNPKLVKPNKFSFEKSE